MNNFFKYFLYLLILSFIFVVLFYITESNELLKVSNNPIFASEPSGLIELARKNSSYSTNELTSMNKCNDQWIRANKYLYFRHGLSFVFLEKKHIEIYFLRFVKYKPSFILKLEIDDQLYQINNITIRNMNQNSYFLFDLLTAEININNIKLNSKINAHIKVDNDSITIPSIQIKSRIKSIKTLLCSKVYYYKKNKAMSFEWWIEMARLNGFDKVVFFNNSLSSEFDFLSKKYKDFIEVIQLSCIPNLLDPNNESLPYLSSFFEIKTIYNIHPLSIHMLFEHLTQNECYLNNKDIYKYIAVIDEDEMIFQTNIENKCPMKNSTMTHYLDTTLKDYVSGGNNLKYFNSTPLSFHYGMAMYLDESLVNQLFSKLENYFNLYQNLTTNTITIEEFPSYKPKLNIKISNEIEYDYAKKLLENYKKTFLSIDRVRFDIPQMYNRFFYTDESATSWICGKTIHNTENTHHLNTHYPYTMNNFHGVNFKYGHVSHFKSEYMISNRNVSILVVKFDFYYLECVFNPVLTLLYP